MPSTRVSPIGRLGRLIGALRPNDQSLFLEAMGGWFHRTETSKTFEPEPASQEVQTPMSGKTLNPTTSGLGSSYHQPSDAHDPASSPTLINRADAYQVEDAVMEPEVQVEDAATPIPYMGPENQSESWDVDLTQPNEERPLQILSKTMVETLPESSAGSTQDSNYLPENLADLFVKKEFVNPQVKALLYGLDEVDPISWTGLVQN